MKENNKDYCIREPPRFYSILSMRLSLGLSQWRVPDMLVGPRIIEMAMLEVASFSDVN